MSNHKSNIPKSEMEEIAKELGVYDKVKTNGWKDVSSKDCGNIVTKSLEIMERSMKDNEK
ncbi:small acid-soluble spore protein F (minor alpha/beta-type SASP) [Mobilisporobacter senegalensis]|uniref:Small acid-soluble spore protein F (Minor alpha/beta-type SASP) n=1 Tax=Mobilisporobacter senegalensis TaxID=1329262 RepID=A0A3N1XSI9_9FIRM|nr:small, acid-soluble spore protein, alpha/beta type [Mobilisporobacter senegalensis]ROR29208.1 small acid-soluble spore protein F (minor alpha/beta-type SASP) [Mobilisporobacter senegalensis]